LLAVRFNPEIVAMLAGLDIGKLPIAEKASISSPYNNLAAPGFDFDGERIPDIPNNRNRAFEDHSSPRCDS
jgi:hypothetical protein